MDEARAPEPTAARDLERLKWLGIILPLVFVFGFELLRWLIGADATNGDSHLIAAITMSGAVIAFGGAMGLLLERTQRQLVHQNRDLTVTQRVGSAIRGDRPLRAMLGDVLEQSGVALGAVAARARVVADDGTVTEARWPDPSPPDAAWATAALAELPTPGAGIRYAERPALDALILELPLSIDDRPLGHLCILFHPARRPDVSLPVLDDLSRELATGIRVHLLVDDLQKRQREQRALYEVAVRLTGRSVAGEALDSITEHARTLLGAERASVILAGGSGSTPSAPGSPPSATADHVLSRSMRGPDGSLGELRVSRAGGVPFTPEEARLLGALADLAAIAVQTDRLREAEQQWTILTERDRIARELHDSIAQVLGHIHLRLRALEGGLDRGTVRAEVGDLADVADEAYRDVREAILGLRETISGEGGLEGALREYLAKYSRQSGIRTELLVARGAGKLLGPRAEVQLLRVAQEALTNVRKHAAASHVTVRITARRDGPELVVEDDGAGFDPATIETTMAGGFGLTAMRERVEQIGGSLTIESRPGTGTRIIAHIRMEDPDGARAASSATAAGR